MKNLIFGSKESLSLIGKYAEVLALFAAVLAILFLPTSYIIPILLISGCVFKAIRAGYTWKRAAWGVAALMVVSQAAPCINLLMKICLVGLAFFFAQKYDQKDNDSDDSQD